MGDKAKDKAKRDADRIARLRASRDKNAKKAKGEQIALAGAKAKSVAQQAKDAIAEGQTKGQLTVVLGKLKANQVTIKELRKEIINVRKQKAGGKGLALKAKLVELKAQELSKRKNGYKARLTAKSKL